MTQKHGLLYARDSKRPLFSLTSAVLAQGWGGHRVICNVHCCIVEDHCAVTIGDDPFWGLKRLLLAHVFGDVGRDRQAPRPLQANETKSRMVELKMQQLSSEEERYKNKIKELEERSICLHTCRPSCMLLAAVGGRLEVVSF